MDWHSGNDLRTGSWIFAVGLWLLLALAARGQTTPASSPDMPAPVAPPEMQEVPPAPPPANQGSSGYEADAGALLSGRGGFGGFASPDVGRLPFRVDYHITWFPDEEVKSQAANLGFVREDFSLVVPLWQNPCDEWSASLHVRNELYHTNAVFPQSGQPFPEDLWAIHLATTYRHLFDNGWIAGGTLSIGSASDQPFHSINEMTAGVSAFLRVPQGEHNAWLFSLSYSSNSELPIPIPGVAFVWQPSDQFHATIGLPFQIMYRPVDDLTLDFSYMLLTSIHARATYRLSPRVRIYAGYDWNNESYLPVDRPNENDRLFYYDQHLTTGVQIAVCRNASVDLSGGYAFDRYYFEGHSLSDSNHNRIDVEDTLFLSAGFQVRW
jgi:hypothetical protein